MHSGWTGQVLPGAQLLPPGRTWKDTQDTCNSHGQDVNLQTGAESEGVTVLFVIFPNYCWYDIGLLVLIQSNAFFQYLRLRNIYVFLHNLWCRNRCKTSEILNASKNKKLYKIDLSFQVRQAVPKCPWDGPYLVVGQNAPAGLQAGCNDIRWPPATFSNKKIACCYCET